MEEQQLEAIFKQFSPLGNTSLSELKSITSYFSMEKGETFLEKGKTAKHEYFVIDGWVHTYLFNPEGEQISLDFFGESSVITPYVIRTVNGKSNINIQSLTNCTLGLFDASDFEQLMVENLEIREFGNNVLKSELSRRTIKEIHLVSETAANRLIHFRNQFSGLENVIPHTHIASYLGISPISLSRLRGKMK